MLAIEALYTATVAFFKISLGLFFLRIIIARKQRQLVYGILVIYTIWCIGYGFFAVFQCGIPSGSRFWVHKITDQCGSDALGLGMGYTHAVLTAGTDIIFVLIPIPIVSKARIKPREKWVIMCIFAVAIM
jgi:hypothetical protein